MGRIYVLTILCSMQCTNIESSNIDRGFTAFSVTNYLESGIELKLAQTQHRDLKGSLPNPLALLLFNNYNPLLAVNFILNISLAPPASYVQSTLKIQLNANEYKKIQMETDSQLLLENYAAFLVLFTLTLLSGVLIGKHTSFSLSVATTQETPFSSDDEPINLLEDSVETSPSEEFQQIKQFLNNGYYQKQFRYVRTLRDSQFGSVELAQHKLDCEFYAIRKIPIELGLHETIENHPVFKEAKILTKLRSKHVLRYYTSWLENTGSLTLYLQMEYCDYPVLNLSSVCSNTLESVEKALSYITNQGVPCSLSKIYVSPTGAPKLLLANRLSYNR